MGHPLATPDATPLDVMLDIPTEEHLLGVTLAALPRAGDHVRIAFVDSGRGAPKTPPRKREFRVERVTFSGTLTKRGDEWRGREFATIVEVTEVSVNKAFLPSATADALESGRRLADNGPAEPDIEAK